MTQLRLIADDLTGALDAAAPFATPKRAIPVFLNGRVPVPLPGSFAIDGATRERDAIFAAAAATHQAPILAPRHGAISFKKVDSLLRGHCGLELVAILRAVPATRCVIAPAFPFHGRVTRAGLQFELRDGSWHRVGEDLRAKLESEGIAVRLARAGGPVPEGASLWDAETDDDLRRIADAGRGLSAPVLWCGSAGLAAALADGKARAAGDPARPILGLFGSEHPATAMQLRACGEHVLRLSDGGVESAGLVAARLEAAGACLVIFDLPGGTTRSAASGLIAREIARLVQAIPPPGSLLVSGGETLGALCLSLRTDHLDVVGQVIPGVPVSVMRGGDWDRVRVFSKSGAFGHDGLLRALLRLDGAPKGDGSAG